MKKKCKPKLREFMTSRAKLAEKERRNPTTSDPVYSAAEQEFMMACERYKRLRKRLFPTCSEILAIAISLGYRKVEAAVELPTWPMRIQQDGSS